MSESGHPLTFGQLSLWRSDEAIPVDNRPEWHFSRVWPVPEELTVADVETALDALTARHESLRTVIVPGASRPRQVVQDIGHPRYEKVRGDAWKSAGAYDVAKHMAAAPFDLTTELPWRVAVLVDDLGRPHFVASAYHHMCVDPWALDVLFEDWKALSAGKGSELAPAVQPRELAELQQSSTWRPRLEAAEEYWRRVLPASALPESTQAPADGEMSFSRVSARQQGTVTSEVLGGAIQTLASVHQVTVPSAAFGLVMLALNALDIVLTEPIILMANNRFETRWRSLVCTQNQAAVLAPPAPTEDIGAFLRAMELSSRLAYRHGCYDIDRFTEVAREVRGEPLAYDFFFNYASTGSFTKNAKGAATEPKFWLGDAPQRTGPKLDLRVTGDETMMLDLRVDPEWLPTDRLQELLAHFHEQAITLHRAAARVG